MSAFFVNMGHTDVEALLLFAIANSFYRLASRAAPDRRSAGRRRTGRPGRRPRELRNPLPLKGITLHPAPWKAARSRRETARRKPRRAMPGPGKRPPAGSAASPV